MYATIVLFLLMIKNQCDWLSRPPFNYFVLYCGQVHEIFQYMITCFWTDCISLNNSTHQGLMFNPHIKDRNLIHPLNQLTKDSHLKQCWHFCISVPTLYHPFSDGPFVLQNSSLLRLPWQSQWSLVIELSLTLLLKHVCTLSILILLKVYIST